MAVTGGAREVMRRDAGGAKGALHPAQVGADEGIDVGELGLQVVCAALNLRAGMMAVLADREELENRARLEPVCVARHGTASSAGGAAAGGGCAVVCGGCGGEGRWGGGAGGGGGGGGGGGMEVSLHQVGVRCSICTEVKCYVAA